MDPGGYYGGPHARSTSCAVTWVYTAPIMAVTSMAPGRYLIEDLSMSLPAAFQEVETSATAQSEQLTGGHSSSGLELVDLPSGPRRNMATEVGAFRATKARHCYCPYKRFRTCRDQRDERK
ncbi:hypothetical protein ISCGN_021933 [Ixodes scapularis]